MAKIKRYLCRILVHMRRCYRRIREDISWCADMAHLMAMLALVIAIF